MLDMNMLFSNKVTSSYWVAALHGIIETGHIESGKEG